MFRKPTCGEPHATLPARVVAEVEPSLAEQVQPLGLPASLLGLEDLVERVHRIRPGGSDEAASTGSDLGHHVHRPEIDDVLKGLEGDVLAPRALRPLQVREVGGLLVVPWHDGEII